MWSRLQSLIVANCRHVHLGPVQFSIQGKPLWLPMAKTKRFKVEQPPDYPKEEEEEWERLYREYDTYMVSLKSFQMRINDVNAQLKMSQAQEISEEGEFDRIMEENNKDNVLVAAHRDKMLIEEWKQTEAEILRMKEEKLKIIAEQKELARIEIEDKIERLKSAIPFDKLDEAIEKALSMEVDYNFAVDRSGKVYQGRLNKSNTSHEDIVFPIQPLVNAVNSSTKDVKDAPL